MAPVGMIIFPLPTIALSFTINVAVPRRVTVWATVKVPFSHIFSGTTQSPVVWEVVEYFEEQELLFSGQTSHTPPTYLVAKSKQGPLL